MLRRSKKKKNIEEVKESCLKKSNHGEKEERYVVTVSVNIVPEI